MVFGFERSLFVNLNILQDEPTTGQFIDVSFVLLPNLRHNVEMGASLKRHFCGWFPKEKENTFSVV